MVEVLEVNEKKLMQYLVNVIDNFNQHATAIQQLLQCVSKPLVVDDRNVTFLLNVSRNYLNELDHKLVKFNEIAATFDICNTLKEMKYIGKRLLEIEQNIQEIREKGIKKEVNLEFTCDGYELVPKPIGYDRKEPIENPNENLKLVLDKLSIREAKMVMHRLGLLGEKEKTYNHMGEIFEISRERCRMIYEKALRKLRKHNRDIVKRANNKKLNKAVFGDEVLQD